MLEVRQKILNTKISIAIALNQTKISHSIGAGLILILSLITLIRDQIATWKLILLGALLGLLIAAF
ncbi:MAG: hypothetical protein Kow0049_02580 [Stanieria sp.]